MPHFHVMACHQIVIVWHGSNHTRDLLPMPSLQALVASADNYLDSNNQNSEGALATGFFCQAYKNGMAKRCKTHAAISGLPKGFQMHNEAAQGIQNLQVPRRSNQNESRQLRFQDSFWGPAKTKWVRDVEESVFTFFWRWLIWPIDIQNKPVWSCMQWFGNKFFIGWSRYVSSIWPAWLLSCAATMAGAGIFSSLVCTDHHPPRLRLIESEWASKFMFRKCLRIGWFVALSPDKTSFNKLSLVHLVRGHFKTD